MATIYIDATEAREDTKLPNAASYVSVTNLERYTGADILISPWANLATTLRMNYPPHSTALHKHCWNGCLIQRKSGHDLLGSIPKLDEIVCRMGMWCQNPWLVYTRIKVGRTGLATVVGSKRRSKWGWKSVQGALNAWMDRGGSVWGLPTDEALTDWLDQRAIAVDKWQVEPERFVSKGVQQAIHIQDPKYYNTLRLFPPKVGVKTVQEIVRYVATKTSLPPTAWIVIQFACSVDSLKVKGWGKGRMKAMREWIGWDRTFYYDGELMELSDVAIEDMVVMREKR